MSSATSRVLATHELLESILIHLPLKGLLQAQLISRHFNSVIRTSPRLRQLLFQWPEQPNPEWRLHPLLSHHFLPFFFIDNYGLSAGVDRYFSKYMKWTENGSTRSAFLRKEASWRNMFVAQPPPSSLLVSRGTYYVDPETGSYREYDATYEEPGEDVSHVSSENGVTMGVIYDLVLSFMTKEERGGVFNTAFESRDDGVRMALRLYRVVECIIDEDGGVLYESEGREVGVDDLEWKQVRQDRLDDEHRLSEMYETWGCDLTLEKGGVSEVEWNKGALAAMHREWMERMRARVGRG